MEHNQCRSLFHSLRTPTLATADCASRLVPRGAFESDFQHDLWISLFMMRALTCPALL